MVSFLPRRYPASDLIPSPWPWWRFAHHFGEPQRNMTATWIKQRPERSGLRRKVRTASRMIRAPNFTHGAGVWQRPVGATVWRQKYIGTTGSVIGQHQEKHTAVHRQTKLLLFVNNCRPKIIGAEDSFSYSQNLYSGPILLLPAERNRVSKTIICLDKVKGS